MIQRQVSEGTELGTYWICESGRLCRVKVLSVKEKEETMKWGTEVFYIRKTSGLLQCHLAVQQLQGQDI